eukprot:CAMPEP_0204051562 /NCGR_PEP_ID=MMETSP0360-20130528/122655_1 /ASSEMBLY_ACC=CAM_ASM_000342 /TAXON_ID=268821 /ORGANISM="Scrippsiella Hangoei, Strain SHTV-5" /LENGTH=64 /DNA_ID=CAMNT_0050998593 /DNA_START=102 /DNA_END=293 /DNA_ORIENTATION=-
MALRLHRFGQNTRAPCKDVRNGAKSHEEKGHLAPSACLAAASPGNAWPWPWLASTFVSGLPQSM